MNIPIHHLLTADQISESHACWSKVGKEGSTVCEMAQSLLVLTSWIKEAQVPNQEVFYKTANLEQCMMWLVAIKQTYNFTYRRIESGLNWLKEVGLLEPSFEIPNLLELHRSAWRLIQQRPLEYEQAEKRRKENKGQNKGGLSW